MSRQVLFGVDVGTSVVKAVALDQDGHVLGTSSRDVPVLRNGPTWAEQDTQLVIDEVAAIVGSLSVEIDGDIALVSITGQGDGCWLLDGDGCPIAMGITWMDGRATDVLSAWQLDGTAEGIAERTGTSVFPGVQALILAWLDEFRPELLDRAHTAAYAKDVVFQAMTGVRTTDPSDASAIFGRVPFSEDVPVQEVPANYDAYTLALCNLEHRAHLLAPVTAPLPLAPVARAAGDRFGLRDGTPVTSGPFDVPACAVGAGVVDTGDALLILGTALACVGPADLGRTGPARARPELNRGGLLVRTSAPAQWVRLMPAMVGTPTLDWALGLLRLRHEDLDPLLQQSSPGAGGVRVLPYFAPSGERAPFVAPAASGQLLGVSLTTTAADILRALCEGLAHVARQCLESMDVTGGVMVCGGGVRSQTWLKIMASTLNRPLTVASTAQVGARGAVMSGVTAAGLGERFDTSSWTLTDHTIDPVPELVRIYDDSHQDFLRDQDEARARWLRGTLPRG